MRVGDPCPICREPLVRKVSNAPRQGGRVLYAYCVRDQAACIDRCQAHLRRPGVFLIVEYDIDVPNRWVPYPLSRTRLSGLFAAVGYRSMTVLAERPSIYQRAPLYSALITP